MSKPVIFSGIQPTGNLHLGNYLGAVKNWVELQNSGEYQMFIFIADLHSLTSNIPPEKLREQTLVTAAEILAAGIDPKKTCLFVQSHVPEHAELAWVLSCVTPLSELQRMTQFKDKSQKQDKNINTGLLNYPILQAADVLLYKATTIPVGKDQVQHLELTRDIARWFNNRFGEFFPEVKPLLTKTSKIMSLVQPLKKMSKSDGAENVLDLMDEPSAIEAKLKKAVTATEGGGESPGVQNLLDLLKEFGSAEKYNEFSEAEKNGSIRYGDLKKELAGSIANHFAEFRTKRAELLKNKKAVEEILQSGANQAKKVAEQTMEGVRKLIGIR
jgi:tryptophanyl-tRNA synthetase